MYCGSCLRDNALATELLRQGHDVTLVPIYTPTRTDERNVSEERVLYGGVNVYLQQNIPLFRRTPWFIDRFFDSSFVMKLVGRLSVSTDPAELAGLTISTLKGEDGFQRKEVEKLTAWMASQPKPDVVVLPNSLMIGLAAPLAPSARLAGGVHASRGGPLSRRSTGGGSAGSDCTHPCAGATRGRLFARQPVLRDVHVRSPRDTDGEDGGCAPRLYVSTATMRERGTTVR